MARRLRQGKPCFQRKNACCALLAEEIFGQAERAVSPLPTFSIFSSSSGSSPSGSELAWLSAERGACTREQLQSAARRVASWLMNHEAPQEVVLLCEERTEFITGLLGIWFSGRVAVLASSAAVAQQIAGEDSMGLVSKRGVELGGRACLELSELLQEEEGAGPFGEQWSSETPLAVLVTSGTTGQPERFLKTAGQLLGEVEALLSVVSFRLTDRVAATIPAHHLYGLLFSVLLPLRAGVPLILGESWAPSSFHPLRVARELREHSVSHLVSVPVHLRSLKEAQVELTGLRAIFCSAAALDPDLAQELERLSSGEVYDVLGSTETGGMALRRPAQESVWRPLPGVSVSTENELLQVVSPYTQLPGEPWFTADRAQVFADQSFFYLGREDGIVKVGGQRISLQEVEQCTRKLSGVFDVAALREGGHAFRGEEIWLAVESEGLTVEQIRAHLREMLPTVFVPRRIRVCAELPRTDRGKLLRTQIRELFRRNGSAGE